MNRKWILVMCIAYMGAMADSTAVAAVIHYTLNNVNFQAPVGPPPPIPTPPGYPAQRIGDDGSAVGTFDYDTLSKTISNISITTSGTPGTLACYEPSPCAGVLHYTGSNYITSIPGNLAGATAQLISDPSNGNNQQILFKSNAAGGGSVYAYPPGGGAATTTACYPSSSFGCTLTLTIPVNSLDAGGVIQLVSEIPNGTQTAPGSADPTGLGVCGTEVFGNGHNGVSGEFVRYVFSTPTCGSLTGSTSAGNSPTSSAGGGLTSLATFTLLVAAYMFARIWLGKREGSA